MKRCRWHLVLPVIGLILFAALTYDSVQRNREWNRQLKVPSKYFFWAGFRLDKTPGIEERSGCEGQSADCIGWDPISVRINPGWLARTLMLSAFPAFIVGGFIVVALARF